MWKVYYDDDTTWDWKQGIVGMPTHGVICILQKVNNGVNDQYHIVYGAQYYMRSQGEWLHSYTSDVEDYLQHQIQIDTLLVGRMTTKRRFAEVFQAAKDDKEAKNL